MGYIIETDGLTKTFGGITAVNNCNIGIEEKSIVCLIEPNGSACMIKKRCSM